MDQTAFTNQGLLRNIRKRSKNTNLVSNLGLRAYSFGEKETQFGYNSLHISTDPECQRIRESRYFTISYELSRHNREYLYR